MPLKRPGKQIWAWCSVVNARATALILPSKVAMSPPAGQTDGEEGLWAMICRVRSVPPSEHLA